MADAFSRKDIDHMLFLIAKEYKKMNRNDPEAELILVGGSSVVLNYNFRDVTTDIDSIFRATSTIKDIIAHIADKEHLSDNWLNDDFKKTDSFSHKLIEHSKFYKRFYDCLTVRTVVDEYLLAMKIRSSRDYKHDQSDIAGIIKENYEKGTPLSLNTIESAYLDLYNENLPQKTKQFLEAVFSAESLEDMYYAISDMEEENAVAIIQADEKYGDALNRDNIANFLKHDIKDAVISNNEEISWRRELSIFIDKYTALCQGNNSSNEMSNALDSAEQISNIKQQIKDVITNLIDKGVLLSDIKSYIEHACNPHVAKQLLPIADTVNQKCLSEPAHSPQDKR